MKKLILTSAFILVTIVSVLAQANRPGQPIGGIVVKGGIAAEGTVVSPLFDQGGNTAVNPMPAKANSDMASVGTANNPYFKDNSLAGENQQSVTGQPIGGIVVKGGSNGAQQALSTSPLYEASGNTHENALYKGKD